MSVTLRVLLIFMSLLALIYVISRIRHSKMQIEYTLFWIGLSIVMIVMAACPDIVYWFTWKMGIMSPANLVYLFIIGVLLVKVFMMTIEISALENKVNDLVQKIGINEKVQQDEMKELGKKHDKE